MILYTITMNAPVGPPNLYRAAAERGNHESAYYGGDKSYCRADAAGYTECYCKRQGDYADYYAGYQVAFEAFAVVMTQRGKQFWSEVDRSR